MLFMLVERFKNRDPVPIYQRLRESGRSALTSSTGNKIHDATL